MEIISRTILFYPGSGRLGFPTVVLSKGVSCPGQLVTPEMGISTCTKGGNDKFPRNGGVPVPAEYDRGRASITIPSTSELKQMLSFIAVILLVNTFIAPIRKGEDATTHTAQDAAVEVCDADEPEIEDAELSVEAGSHNDNPLSVGCESDFGLESEVKNEHKQESEVETGGIASCSRSGTFDQEDDVPESTLIKREMPSIPSNKKHSRNQERQEGEVAVCHEIAVLNTTPLNSEDIPAVYTSESPKAHEEIGKRKLRTIHQCDECHKTFSSSVNLTSHKKHMQGHKKH